MKKYWRGFICGLLTAALVLALCLSALAISGRMTIEVDPIDVMVNGKVFQPKDANGKDVPVFAYNGTTYAPLRALAEAYGLKVGYDATRKLATVGTDESMISNNSGTTQKTEAKKPGTAEIAPAVSRAALEPDYKLSGPTSGYFQKLDSATGYQFTYKKTANDHITYSYPASMTLEQVAAELEAYVDLLLKQGNFEAVVPFGLNKYVDAKWTHYSACLKYTGTRKMKGGHISAYTKETHHIEVAVSEDYREVMVSFDANLTPVDASLRTPNGAKLLSAQQVSGQRAADACYKDGNSYYNGSDGKLTAISGGCGLLINGEPYTAQAEFRRSDSGSYDCMSITGFYRGDEILLLLPKDQAVSGDVFGLGQLSRGKLERTNGKPAINLYYGSAPQLAMGPSCDPDTDVPEAAIRVLRLDKSGDTVMYFHMKAYLDGKYYDIEGLAAAPWSGTSGQSAGGNTSFCHMCGGDGKCHYCSGTGVVTRYLGGFYQTIPCGDCQYVGNGKCCWCDGTGKQ